MSQEGPKQPLNKTIGGGSPSKIDGGGTYNKSASSGAKKEEAKVETVSSIVYADSNTKFSKGRRRSRPNEEGAILG